MRRTTWLLLCCVLVAAGCWGYRPDTLYRPDIHTIYVAGFDNETYRRGLEVPLTRAVVGEVELRTPLKLAARDEADSVLTGELLKVEEGAQVRSGRGLILLQRVTLTVRFRWRDRLTGALIVPEQIVTESTRVAVPDVEFVASETGELVPADLIPQDVPSADALGEVARRIVERMEQNW